MTGPAAVPWAYAPQPRVRDVERRFHERGHCCWCRARLEGRQRLWCSQRCIDDYLRERGGPGWRDAVLCANREAHGGDLTCMICDASPLEQLRQHQRNDGTCGWCYAPLEPLLPGRRPDVWYLGYCSTTCQEESYRPADADHIQPVALGGDPTALENGQVLCRRCHRRKTAGEDAPLIAAARQQARRAAGTVPLAEFGLEVEA